MARLVYEASGLTELVPDVSFSITINDDIIVKLHDDINNSYQIYEVVSVADLVASYIGLSLTLDLDKNDAVTTGHRLGKTFRG
jgi:hypothetical protein